VIIMGNPTHLLLQDKWHFLVYDEFNDFNMNNILFN
jgi:hypothetical protein